VIAAGARQADRFFARSTPARRVCSDSPKEWQHHFSRRTAPAFSELFERRKLCLNDRETVKQSRKSKRVETDADGHSLPITAYSQSQPLALRTICDVLRELIDAVLPKAASKVWHGSPVWFMGENPVVGYNATAKTVNLLFWNGQAFDEPALRPVGKYRAAQAVFREAAEIDPKVVRRWLKKAKSDVFDSKAYFQKLREGK
jgi:hypothetical protein